jgi:small GTP-binding protein
MDLRVYEQDKFEIAEVLRSASAIAGPDHGEWHKCARDLFARLAEDRFNLVLVGRFSRGKSTLTNAILATDRLPTGIVPLTSVITSVAYGSRERVVLKFRDSMLSTEIPIAALPHYVTQQGNPGNAKRIEAAEVQLPAELLRRGFYFVDTPGLGSAIEANTRTTESFLSEADAFLLVTSYESPLSDDEMRFFRAAAASARRIFVALNKQDVVSQDERTRALSFVREQLRAFLGESAPPVFSVSAREGLAAKQSGDANRLAASGVLPLERALLRFLLTEKTTEFLFGMCNRVADLVREAPRSPASVGLLERIDALVRRLAPDRQRQAVANVGPTVPTTPFPGLQQLAPCEICAHVANAVWDELCRYQYEISTNPHEQRHFTASGGLCNFHTWDYHATVSAKATSTAYPALAERLASWFRQTASEAFERESLPRRLLTLLPSEDSCALCRVQAKAETEAISVLARRLETHQVGAIESLSAICLPHIAVLVASIEDVALLRKLMARQATILERISEDMRRYALKHEGTKRFLMSEEEEKAGDRTLMLIAGHKALNVVRKARYTTLPGAPPADPGGERADRVLPIGAAVTAANRKGRA